MNHADKVETNFHLGNMSWTIIKGCQGSLKDAVSLTNAYLPTGFWGWSGIVQVTDACDQKLMFVAVLHALQPPNCFSPSFYMLSIRCESRSQLQA